MTPNLETRLRPEARMATALGRLLADWAGTLEWIPRDRSPRRHLWINQPGQSRVEAFALSALVTATLAGLTAGWLGSWLGLHTPRDWLMLALLMVPGFFALAHGLIFTAWGVDALIRITGIPITQSPGLFCGRIVLGLLTTICAVVWCQPESGRFLRSVATFWLLMGTLNAVAWILLRMRGLINDLARHDDPA